MSLTVGELFVNLGVKGADTSVRALTTVKTGLSEVASNGLAAKAAVIGVIYALEQMTSKAANFGNGIQQFENTTGMSGEMLQRWQYLLTQSGVGAEAATSSLSALQKVMFDFEKTGSTPIGWSQFINKLGDVDMTKLQNTAYMLGKLREYALKETDIPRANKVLDSFGVGAMTGALRTSKVDIDNIPNWAVTSSGKIAALSSVKIQWDNLFQKFESNFGEVVAKEGPAILKDINEIADAILKLTQALAGLETKIGIFSLLGRGLEGLAKGLAALNNPVKGSGTRDFFGDAAHKGQTLEEFMHPGGLKPTNSGPSNNVNIKQDLHFQHDGKDAKRTGNSVKEAVKTSYYQMYAQTQVT